jgi:uncharacterized SAM-binding protein YcdF (DUF218 family)
MFTPLTDWWAARMAGSWTDPKGEVLIVLGADVISDRMIGESSYWRSVYAVRAWREDRFREIVISGVETVSDPMREFIVSQGVPASAVRTESRSRSTRENALYTTELLRSTPGRKVLLTSDYHMFRAVRAFRKAGTDPLPRPIPDARKRSASWTSRWSAFLDLCSETAKIAYYAGRGWI